MKVILTRDVTVMSPFYGDIPEVYTVTVAYKSANPSFKSIDFGRILEELADTDVAGEDLPGLVRRTIKNEYSIGQIQVMVEGWDLADVSYLYSESGDDID